MKTLHSSNLTDEIDSLTNDGYRLDMIMPADDPREAILSKDGESLRLVLSPGISRQTPPEGRTQNWTTGRAGMEYRDLIPDRLGGRAIASHIRIMEAGPVPDYVHYHKVWFQMIYCKAGWIRVVYEDQGDPFVMEAGDCVLQPPEIRHRVLESSAGAEVIEVSSPAEHETWVDHELQLPSSTVDPHRLFAGQRFVRHRASAAEGIVSGTNCQIRETGIAVATGGMGGVRTVKVATNEKVGARSGFMFVYVLCGTLLVGSGSFSLRADDHFVVTNREGYSMTALEDSEILEVTLREI